MAYINPEIAAHNIATIFCEKIYEKVAADVHEEPINMPAKKKPFTGNPNSFTAEQLGEAAKELATTYSNVYDTVFSAIGEINLVYEEICSEYASPIKDSE